MGNKNEKISRIIHLTTRTIRKKYYTSVL